MCSQLALILEAETICTVGEINAVEYLFVGIDSSGQGREVADHLQGRHCQQARKHASQFGQLDHEVKLGAVDLVADLFQISNDDSRRASLFHLQDVRQHL